jgi:hypothetical protein
VTMRRGRYARRLLAVAAVVAALVGLGFLWRSSSLASIVSDGGGGRSPQDRSRGTAFSLSNISDLVTTLLIGVGVMCFVIFIDKARRRRRPIRPVAAPVARPTTIEVRDKLDTSNR